MKRLSGTSYLVAASLALLLSACGGGDSDADARPTSDANDTDAPPQIDGAPQCTALTLADPEFFGGNANTIQWQVEIPTVVDPGVNIMRWEFWSGIQPDLTGTWDLTVAPDDNYATCSTCVRLFAGVDEGTGELTRQFFQSGGTVTLTEDPFTAGHMIGTMDDVTLVEVTIDDMTAESTPVPGGGCLTLPSTVTLNADTIPTAWTCPDAAFADGATCDCMCGAPDPDCDTPANPVNGCTVGQVCNAGVCETPPPPPVNDSCPATIATAVPILIGVPVNGTTLGATDDFNDGLNGCTGFDQPGGDVVYRVNLPAATDVTVTLSAPDATYDSAIALIRPGTLAGCNAEPVNCLAGADATLAGEDETFTFTTVAGGFHWIVVDAYQLGVAGNFTLTVTTP